MAYTDDLTALQTYLTSNLDPESDAVVFLYRLAVEISSILSDTNTLASLINSINTEKATGNNQTTLINRLTSINTTVSDNINGTIADLITSSNSITTELQTGLLKTAVDNVLTEVQTGNIKLNLDSLVTSLDNNNTSLGAISTQLDSVIANQSTGGQDSLIGLDPNAGINDTLLLLITDIRNNIGNVGANGASGGTNIILTDQLLVAEPTIRNVILGSANTEYSVVLPAGTRRFSIKSRLNTGDPAGLIRYSYTTGVVANSTPVGDDGFYTIGDFVEDTEDSLNLTSPLTIYFGSDVAGVVVTIKYWGPSTASSSVPPSVPLVRNINMVNADTEYLWEFPMETKRFAIKVRGNTGDNTGLVRLAYVAGVVATGAPVGNQSYLVLQPDGELLENALGLGSTFRVYFASSVANIALTIEYWT